MDNRYEIPEYFEIPDNCLSTTLLTHLFWASYYGDPLTSKTQTKLSKSEFAPPPFAERAHDPSWQRKYDRKLDKAIATLQEGGSEEEVHERLYGSLYEINIWMMDEAFKSDPSGWVEGRLEQMRRELDGERLVSGLWLRFEKIASEFKNKFPDNPKTMLFEYILSLKRTQFEDEVDLLLLMLIAWLEFESLSYGNEIGSLYKESKYYGNPLATWIPVAKSGKLKTTRYCVMDYYLKKNSHKKAEPLSVFAENLSGITFRS